MPDLSVIVVSWNTRDLLLRCLETLRAAAGSSALETIVVDNGSTDGSLEALRSLPDVRLIANAENVGFAAANNQGLAIASAPVALLLNSDAFVNGETLSRAVQVFAEQPRAGIVGVTVLNDDGSVQAAEGVFPTLGSDLAASIGLDQLARSGRRAPSIAAVDWVHGACLFVRMDAYRMVGGLDTRFFMYSEEVEWCWRMWHSGAEVWIEPAATVIHLGGASSARNDVRRRSALYRSRIGLRRRMSGRRSGVCLWLGMLAGLSGRVVVRGTLGLVTRRQIGRQSAAADWALLCDIARSDPLARWSVS